MAQQVDGSWRRLITITVAACVAVGGLLWLIAPKGPPLVEAEPEPTATRSSDRAAAAAQKVDSAVRGTGSQDPSDPDRPTKADRLEARLGKPPKLSVQISDPMAGTCPVTFSVPMVVRVIRGEFDDVVAEARIPKDKITRTRQLIYADGDWTGTLGGLPINRTVQLVIIGTGPYGQETVYKDVSHVCPGDPIDKNDPYDLVGKDAERAIKEKMFDGEFEFEFDFDSAGKSSGESADQ